MIVEPPNFSQSAHFLFTNRQKIFILLLCLILILILIIYPYPCLIFLNGIAILFYLVSIFYKVYLYCLGLKIKNTIALPPCNQLKDEELPTYTILVPLYREREVIEQLIDNLNKIDYPKDKLQILLLLELDDKETREALKVVKLPKHFRVVEIPQTYPKTKPKALNYGLKAANGELLVIYDAEDEPAVDQLKLAAEAYSQNWSKNIACY